jgi:poly(3-hydroxybutyrate) depolymerase
MFLSAGGPGDEKGPRKRVRGMLYQAYQIHSGVMAPVRALARIAASLDGPAYGPKLLVLRNLTAAYEIMARTGLTHERPPFRIALVRVGDREVGLRERAVFSTPFGTLLHFEKDSEVLQPRVLPVAQHFEL